MPATQTVTTTSALASVMELLEAYKGDFVASDNPFVNQQLAHLLGSLYKTQKDLGILAAPVVIDTSNMSSADLIAILMTETRRTSNLVATATIQEVKTQQKKIVSSNDATIKKLDEASSAAKEAQNLKDGLGIFKWVMLAVSILLLICSIVATICTFGAAAPTIAAAVAVLVASVIMTVLGSVPVDDEQNTAMDLTTKKLAEAISACAKQNLIDDLKDQNKNWDKMSDEEQQVLINEATETGTYSAVAIMITIQVLIAVVLAIATAGAASGTSAGYVVNAAATTGMNTAKAALESAKDIIINNLSTITAAVRNITLATQAVQGAGTVASGAASIAAAKEQWDADNANADADYAKAYSTFLTKNNDLLIGIVEEFYEDINASYTQVANVLRSEHRSRMIISQNVEGASFA